MKLNALVANVTALLAQHGRTLIQVLALIVVGLLTYMFGTVITDSEHEVSVWLFFVLVILSFTVIIAVIFWAIRSR